MNEIGLYGSFQQRLNKIDQTIHHLLRSSSHRAKQQREKLQDSTHRTHNTFSFTSDLLPHRHLLDDRSYFYYDGKNDTMIGKTGKDTGIDHRNSTPNKRVSFSHKPEYSGIPSPTHLQTKSETKKQINRKLAFSQSGNNYPQELDSKSQRRGRVYLGFAETTLETQQIDHLFKSVEHLSDAVSDNCQDCLHSSGTLQQQSTRRYPEPFYPSSSWCSSSKIPSIRIREER